MYQLVVYKGKTKKFRELKLKYEFIKQFIQFYLW